MTPAQGYVSRELSHFVGNTAKGQTEEEQYDVLVNKILKTGWLTYPPHDPTKPRSASVDLSKPISTDDLIIYQVVCFCDIPVSDLAIHVGKYGRFGLSFEKEFLVKLGASPVFYIANDSPVPETQLFRAGDFAARVDEAVKRGPPTNRALYFDTSVRGLIDIIVALDAIICEDGKRYFPGSDADVFKERLEVLLGLSKAQIAAVDATIKGNAVATSTFRQCANFLLNYVFTNMKCFNSKREFHDADNFYMEREWRIGNNVGFSIDDVARVFFPASYAKRFRADLPSYTGQISFVD